MKKIEWLKSGRLAAALVAAVLIFSLLGGFFIRRALLGSEPAGTESAMTTTSQSAAADPGQILSGVRRAPADGVGVPGEDFAAVKTGPADDWEDTPIPLFNPLGSRSLYEQVQYLGNNGDPVVCHTLDGYTERSESLTGERWQLTIPADAGYSLYWLRWQTQQAGGQWYDGTRDHSTFSIRENDTALWWADVRETETGSAELTIVRTNTLAVGKTITLHPADLDNQYVFYTDCLPGKLMSASIKLKGPENSGVAAIIRGDSQIGRYQYHAKLQFAADEINIRKTDTFVLDNLPLADQRLCWQVSWGADAAVPEEISFTINPVADIAPVKWGEAPGAIRIVGVPLGSARVLAPVGTEITHDEVALMDGELTGMTDENGAMLFAAPSGYYNIAIPSGLGSEASFLRLVPVNAGEITTVTIPAEMATTTGSLSRLYNDFTINEGGIELLASQAAGKTAAVSFVLNDPLDREVSPTKEDVKITENGMAAEIVKIEREPAGSDVVLVLDSSGSMGDSMKPCVEAARQFVASLPANSTIRLIQFAQAITEYPGTDKASALAALNHVKAGGATSLYDATDRALQLLSGSKRGYAVVFSDGADSREPGVDGTGSTMTREQLLERIRASGTTVLTIGFGKGHDPATLIAMAGATPNGGYFAAADKTALSGAFASAAGKFGNQFTVTYNRPVIPVDQNSDVPVVSLMIDRSGSMDMDPAEGDNVGWRMDRIKAMFHDFVLKLPQGILMQSGSFAEPEGGEEPRYDQITTDQKAAILQAVGSLNAGGGTPTLTALRLAYANLAPIPSQKRVLVFFTDAALCDQEEPELFDELLAEIRQSGVRVLFAGLATGTEAAALDAIFRTAAEKAGGDYILTDSVDQIARKLDELINRINTPSARTGVDFSLGIDCAAGNGSRVSFSAGRNLPDLAPLTGPGRTLTPQKVDWRVGEAYAVYDRSTAQLLSGDDQPGVQSRVLLRLPFQDKSLANSFARLTVRQAYLLDLFKGIEAPSGQAFLALDAELAFQKADASSRTAAYLVPDIFNHCFVSLNEGQMMPASEATWLAEQPFADPGERAVEITAEQPNHGVLIFLVDFPVGSSITQLSLHLYDTVNGSIELPLAGGLTARMLQVGDLPTQEPARITDAFSLSITGKTEQRSLANIELPYAAEAPTAKDISFRVLEAQFDVKVQALLDIDPTERLLCQLDTDCGALLVPMSRLVNKLPLGFAGKTMLAPGSCNQVRLPFILPDALLNVRSFIFGDLANGSLLLPVTGGPAYVSGLSGQTFKHRYFDLTVNALALAGEDSNQVVLDFTLTDKQDGQGTGGLESVLLLKRKDALAETGAGQSADDLQLTAAGRKGLGDFTAEYENAIGVNMDDTQNLVFGAAQAKGVWSAYDGQSRRGIYLFDLPEGDPADWILTCSEIPDLRVPLDALVYPCQTLLAENPMITTDKDFVQTLDEAVTAAVTAYQATRSEPGHIRSVGLSDDEVLGKQVPAPSLTLFGSQKIKAVQADQDFVTLMGSLAWLPGGTADGALTTYRYAPEAVLTQGWGAQNDLAVLARSLLARLGYQPQYRLVTLTAEGQENLKRLGGVDKAPAKLTGVAYYDAQGKPRLYVPALNRDLADLHGLCYLAASDEPVVLQPAMGRLTIELTGKLVGSAGMAAAAGLMGDVGAILGGGEGDSAFYETVTAFDREMSLPDMSLDALDISYIATARRDGGELVLPVLDTRQGLLYDPHGWIDSSAYAFEQIIIRLDDGSERIAAHTTRLDQTQKLTDICHTLAWNVPEIMAAAVSPIESMAKSEAAASENPAKYSISRWLGHATIGRLVKSLADMGRETAGRLNLTAGRSTESIALVVTQRSDGSQTEAVVDLVNHRNQLHSGHESAQHAYNLIFGLFASDLEASALPGGVGIGYLDVWSQLPDDAGINLLAMEEQGSLDPAAIAPLGCPPLLLSRIQQINDGQFRPTLFLVPNKPAEINGKARWAWMEIDLQTYDTVSVFDTGERAGMGEYLIGCFPENYAEVGAGAIVGMTTALGSVAAYSLSIDDYDTVMKAAQDLCQQIGEQLGTVTGVTGAISAGGKVWEGVGGHEIQWEKLAEAGENTWVNKLTFDEGYKAAVKAYFG